MKIVHLRSSGGFFGAEGVILNLARELNKIGIVNSIMAINNSKNPNLDLVNRAKTEVLAAENVTCRGMLDFKAIREIRTHVVNNKVDIVHCHDYKANFFGFCACLFLKVGLVATNHLWTSETRMLRLYEFLDGIILNFFTAVIAVSNDLRRRILPFIVNKRKVITIYNGIDLEQFVPGHKEPTNSLRKEFNIPGGAVVIGAVGRMSPQKGFDYLIQAARMIVDACPQAVFVIVGDGDADASLKARAKKLYLDQNIIFAGKRSDMKNFYDLFDIFVISSIDEGFPLILLEALAMKKAVVATAVGDIPEVIKNGYNGLLIESKSSQAIADAVIKLMQDGILRGLCCANARPSVENIFSASMMAQRYLEVYKTLL